MIFDLCNKHSKGVWSILLFRSVPDKPRGCFSILGPVFVNGLFDRHLRACNGALAKHDQTSGDAVRILSQTSLIITVAIILVKCSDKKQEA